MCGQVADGVCERAGLSLLMGSSTLVRRIAWTLELGRHRMTPSWALTYGKTNTGEDLLDVLDYMAMASAVNADVSYVRYIMTGDPELK